MRSHRLPLSVFALLWLVSLPAAANEPPALDRWPVERNAQQLRVRETKIGLFGVDVGVHDRLQVGTLWSTWPLLAPNLHVKGLLLDHRGWRLAVETSFFYVNLERLRWFRVDDFSGAFLVLPIELFVDKQVHRRWLVGLGSGYLLAHTTPEYTPQSLSGTGAYDSWLLRGHVTTQATRLLWLVLEVDWILYQLAGATGTVEAQVDEYIHVEGKADAIAQSLDPAQGAAATLSMELRAGAFGFRFGLGYGNFVLPRVRVVSPVAIPYLTLDVFARFGGRG